MSALNTYQKPNTAIFEDKISDRLYENTMKIFNTAGNNEVRLSIELFRLLSKIENISFEVDQYGNFLITKGNAEFYPCFIAHTDTVHTYHNGFNLVVKDGVLYAYDDKKKQVGCGGDDRAGVSAIVELLHRLDAMKACLFTGEESGGIGSGGVDLGFFNDCSFLASIDRWNNCDIVNSYGGYKTISKKFKKLIKPLMTDYGYKFNSGMFTDCFNLVDRGVELSAINVSCGYYQHHSQMEHVVLSELQNCVDFCENLAHAADNFQFKFEIGRKQYNYLPNGGSRQSCEHLSDANTRFSWFDDELDSPKKENEIYDPSEYKIKGACEDCGEYCDDLLLSDSQWYVCEQCYNYWKDMYKEDSSDKEYLF